MRTVLFIAVVLCALSAALGNITVVFDGGSSGTKIITMGNPSSVTACPTGMECVDNFKLAKSLHETYPAVTEAEGTKCKFSKGFGQIGTDSTAQCNSATNYARALISKRDVAVRGSTVSFTIFMATAGMRSISQSNANSIVSEVNSIFGTGSNKHGLEVTGGTKEAFYEWFTVNYGIAGGSASAFLTSKPSGHLGIGGMSAQISLILESSELSAWNTFVSGLAIGTDFVAVPPTGTLKDYVRMFNYITSTKTYNIATVSYMGLPGTISGIGNMNFAGGTDAVQARSGCKGAGATEVVAKCRDAVLSGIANDPFVTKFNAYFTNSFSSLVSGGRKLTLITNANFQSTIGRWKLSTPYAYTKSNTHEFQALVHANCACTRMCAHMYNTIGYLRGMGLLGTSTTSSDSTLVTKLDFVQVANQVIASGFSDDWAVGAAALKAIAEPSPSNNPSYTHTSAAWGIKPVKNLNVADFPTQSSSSGSSATVSGLPSTCPSSLLFDDDSYDADNHHANFNAYREYAENNKEFQEYQKFVQMEEMRRDSLLEQQRQAELYQQQQQEQQQEQEQQQQQTALLQVKEDAKKAVSSDDSDLSDADLSTSTD